MDFGYFFLHKWLFFMPLINVLQLQIGNVPSQLLDLFLQINSILFWILGIFLFDLAFHKLAHYILNILNIHSRWSSTPNCPTLWNPCCSSLRNSLIQLCQHIDWFLCVNFKSLKLEFHISHFLSQCFSDQLLVPFVSSIWVDDLLDVWAQDRVLIIDCMLHKHVHLVHSFID